MFDIRRGLQSITLHFLDGNSLAMFEATCHDMREQIEESRIWHALVLRLWGWLCRSLPRQRTWKWLYSRLDSRSRSQCIRFCVVGSNSMKSCACAYEPSTKAWTDFAAPAQERNMAAVVRNASGELCVMGGLIHGNELKALSSAEAYQSGRIPEWRALPDMSTSRCCCSGALDSRGNIYVVGGGESMYRHSQAWDTVEMLEPFAESWSAAPSMIDARCALGVAYSFEHDSLFAAGGYGGDNRYLQTAEWLHLSSGSSGTWQPLPPLSCKRAGCNAAVGPDHRVFVVGGGPDGQQDFNTMEALDPRECRWQTDLAPLRHGRHYNAAAFGPDGCLYVAGAFRHLGQLDVVERYDPRMNSWEDLPSIGKVVNFSAGAFCF